MTGHVELPKLILLVELISPFPKLWFDDPDLCLLIV